jgi:hypothetical protein
MLHAGGITGNLSAGLGCLGCLCNTNGAGSAHNVETGKIAGHSRQLMPPQKTAKQYRS